MSGNDLRERYFEAAQEILATEGYGGLKLAAVCKRLKVTTGAFYHAFSSWNEFTTALLDNWRRQRTTLIIEVAKAPDPVVQLQSLLAATVELQHGTEAAIRVWAAVDPEVAKVQAEVDRDRYEIVLDAMQRLVGKKEAPLYANWGLNILVGFEAVGDHRTDELAWQLGQVLELALARSEKRKRSRRRTA